MKDLPWHAIVLMGAVNLAVAAAGFFGVLALAQWARGKK